MLLLLLLLPPPPPLPALFFRARIDLGPA